MCEKNSRKIKKNSNSARLREARRVQRIQRLTVPVPPEPTPAPCPPQTAEQEEQNKVLLELALKTVALMEKNKLIQAKISALQKETSEFVAKVMSNPENQQRYKHNIRVYAARAAQIQAFRAAQNNQPPKTEATGPAPTV